MATLKSCDFGTKQCLYRTLIIFSLFSLVILSSCKTPKDSETERGPSIDGVATQMAQSENNPKTGFPDLNSSPQTNTSPSLDLDGLDAYLNLKKGMVVGDIGCGIGRLTFPLAKAIGPEGTVYALDIKESALDVVKDRCAFPENENLHNILLILNKPYSTTLPPHTLDLALLVGVHFHNKYKLSEDDKSMITSILETLKPGGRLVIKDGSLKDQNSKNKNHRNSLQEMADNTIKNFTKAGFKLETGPIIKTVEIRYIVTFLSPTEGNRGTPSLIMALPRNAYF